MKELSKNSFQQLAERYSGGGGVEYTEPLKLKYVYEVYYDYIHKQRNLPEGYWIAIMRDAILWLADDLSVYDEMSKKLQSNPPPEVLIKYLAELLKNADPEGWY